MPTKEEVEILIAQLDGTAGAAGRTQASRDLQDCLHDEACEAVYGEQIREAYDDLDMTHDDIEGLPADDD